MTSPIEDVMAVDRTAQLTAVARDASNDPISGKTFTWQSSEPSVASVDEGGGMQGLKGGTTTISASADGVSGTLEMRVVEADLSTISTLLADSYTDALSAALGEAQSDRIQVVQDECAVALDAGHVLDLSDCLKDVPDDMATDPTDRALLSVLAVIALRAELLLNL